ncbi:MAG: glycosyl hydrolase family 28-related protein, partial [Kiritimatiellales bacterium]
FYMSLSDGKILNSSISAKQYGAKIKARNDFFISNNDFYSEAGAGASTNVELTGCSEVFVTGNRFQGGGTARTGVSLLSLKVVSRYCGAQTLISDNIFGVGGTIGTGVSVGANMVETMIFSNTLNTATAYVDNGIGTRFVAGAPDPFVSPAAAGDNENFSWGGIQGTVCNVKSFGATGNGYDDDTTFIKKAAAQAVTYLNNGCKAVLYFPAGTYKLNQRIDLVLNTGCATNLMIYGDGMGVSVIERYPGTTPTGVFNVIVPSTVRVDIHNLMLVARYANAGTGIYVKASRIPASGPSLYMHNILIANRGGANYFNPSIQLENLCDPFFQKVRIEMLNGDFSNATGVKITGGKGFSCEHSTLAGQLGVGLDIMNSLGGDILIKSSMEFGLGAVTNAKINAGGGRFAVDGAHMNCIERNADITNAAGGVSWVNSLTLNHDFNRGAGRADMRLASCKNVRIRNNHFNAGGHGGVAYGYNMDRRAIWLAGAANTNVIVYGNLFAECGAASIYSDAGWIGPKLRFNRFTRTDIADEAGPVSECTRAYELNGLIGEDYLIRNKASGKYLTATNTSASSTTCVETNIGDDVLWNVVYDRLSNQYLLTNKKVGKMLKRNGTDVECSGTVNDTSTQWYIWKQADDYYTLKNTQGTAYLTRAGNEVNCNSTVVGDTNKWEMILAYDLIMGMERKSLNVPNNSWREVRIEKHFEHAPAVFASLGGSANAWPLTVRVTNVTTTSFWLQTQDWESKDNTSHSDEELTYIAMQKGRYDYKGRKVEAGTIPGVGTGWTTRPFEVPFAAPPVVFAQCTSCLGPATVCTRITNVTATSFQIKIQSQSGTHSSEAVDFIAIDPGTCPYFEVGRTTGVTGSWPVPPPSLSFVSAGGWPNAGFAGSVQTFNDSDPCTLRYNLYSITKTNIAVKVDDPNVDDPNGAHGAETVGWMVFETR